MNNQSVQVLHLLRQRGRDGITQMQALVEAGTMRLAARIKDLRDKGHRIETRIEKTPRGARIARYILEPEASDGTPLGEVLAAGIRQVQERLSQ